MQTIASKRSPRPGVVRHRPKQTAFWLKMLGGVVLFAWLYPAVPVMGAIPVNPYVAVLAWDPSSDTMVSGYRIYYGTTSGNYSSSITEGNATSTIITGLAAGVTYYFAITAYYPDGAESDYSGEISFVPGQTSIQLSAGPNHQIVLLVDGLISHGYDILATQDLKIWSVIGSVTTGSTGSTSFTDIDAGLFSKRFYRTRAMP